MISPPHPFLSSFTSKSSLSTLSCHLSSACSYTLTLIISHVLLNWTQRSNSTPHPPPPQLRIQHEVYPPDTEQASRLVLLVHDVEMRDRLAHSQINKFLYQYTTEAMPRQSHANMVRS